MHTKLIDGLKMRGEHGVLIARYWTSPAVRYDTSLCRSCRCRRAVFCNA